MAIDVHCPHCGARLHVAERLVGHRGKCPKCAEAFIVAASPTEPPPLPANWESSEPAREGRGPEIAAVLPSSTIPAQCVPTRSRWVGRPRVALTAVTILAVLTAVVGYFAATRPPGSAPVSEATVLLGESNREAQPEDVQRRSDEELLRPHASPNAKHATPQTTPAKEPTSAAPPDAPPTAQKPPSPEKSLDPAALYAKCSPAVATIVTKDDLGFEACQGSGFFVDPDYAAQNYNGFAIRQRLAKESRGKPGGPYQDAYLLTNHHVIESAATAEVRLQDGRSGTVDDVVVEDEDLDLALVSVTIWDSPTPPPTLAFVEQAVRKKSGPVEHLGGRAPVSEALSGVTVGEKVYAIGSPKGLEASLSEGIISGKREVRPDVWCLQTTAPVSGGSSGGPLLDSGGRVLGVVRASRRSAQNLNFAVPAVHAIDVLGGPYNTRKLWHGSGLREEEASAYISARVALKDSKAVVEGWKIGVLLGEVQEQLRDHKTGEARGVLARATPFLFGEYEYLVHYTLGRCAHARVGDVSRGATTVGELRQRYRDNADLQLAKRECRRSIELKPAFSPAYWRLAECLLSEAYNEDGLKLADLLAKMVPRCTTAYKLRGGFYGELGRHVQAREDFRKAVEFGPNDPESRYELGVECVALDENAEAIEAFEAAMRLKCRLWKVCPYSIGIAYKKMGKWELALAYFEQAKALEGFPTGLCDAMIAECRRRLKAATP